jgi:hypothetical protein
LGVAVEVTVGPVVAHGHTRVGVAGGDLHIAQADAGIQHGGHVDVAQHVRMHPWEDILRVTYGIDWAEKHVRHEALGIERR